MFMRSTTVGMAILITFGTGFHVKSPVLTSGGAPDRVSANDNRVPAGTLLDGILTVRLEMRQGEWHPDGETETGVQVRAFAEEGKGLQIPGPLIRVAEGTEIRVSVRNTTSDAPLVVHGLHARGAASGADTIHVQAGGTREIRFVADAPGTYYYWGTTKDLPDFRNRSSLDTQLYGALIVEPRGVAAEGDARDRVFVLGAWADQVSGQVTRSSMTRMVINGKSWPNTERLEHLAGDSVRWRVINASSLVHPMHLHGFYYRVTSRGDGRTDSIFAASSPPRMVVTQRLGPSQTMSLLWIPVRPGNWLFHCHDNVHILPGRPLPGAPPVVQAAHHVRDHAREMMGGLVMAIHVRPNGSMRVTPEPAAVRRLRLVARVDTGGTPEEPAYGFALEEPSRSTSTSALLPGPTIVLRRGEPTAITVVNELPEATSVHWHGMELQSYFDGVPDFAGQPGRVAPAIAPRDSFVARFTPPRAGTFMYHTHVDEVRQQKAGLSGVMIVLEPTATFDPATDLSFLITTPRLEANSTVVYLNGSMSPATIEMRAGTRYRLRVLNLHTFRPSMRFEVRKDSALVMWRALAKDGADLPSTLATSRPASQQLGNGEIYDFELMPAVPGDLRIDVTTGAGGLLVTVPIRVR
jgi:FtsP/CotA-like multicopper oxidase with cupredoxin domain